MNTFPFARVCAWFVLGVVMLASLSLMLQASGQDSGITDELAHIPAGYGYVKYHDYRLNPEHPPLLKMIAMFPVTFLDPVYPTDNNAWTTAVNGQWDMGTAFLFHSGNDADLIIHLARLGPILLTLLLILLIYIWAKDMFGPLWALLPATIFGLSPNVIAHGHYVTTDVAAAFGIALSTYAFLKYLEKRTGSRLFWAGIAFGVAQACKFSAVLIVPYFAFLLFILWLKDVRHDWHSIAPNLRFGRLCVKAWEYLKIALIMGAIGYLLVIYPLYFTLTRNYPMAKQTSDTVFILQTYAHGPTAVGAHCTISRCIADLDIWMTKHDLTRPYAQYLLGVLMVQQRAAGGNTAYFLGSVNNTGSFLYFPTVYGLKEPLPVLGMLAIAILLALAAIWRGVRAGRGMGARFWNYIENHFANFAIVFFIVFYWLYSIHTNLNIGFRHLFPTLPFIYLSITEAWRGWIFKRHDSPAVLSPALIWFWIKEIIGTLLKYLLLSLLIVWFVIETFAAAPYFLSYFNELGGGPMGGYRYVTDSNYDWGQDLLRLQSFVATHPDIDKIAVDYFGAGQPHYYLGDKETDWWSSKGDPRAQGIHWIAISINTLQGSIQPTINGLARNSADEYHWLTDMRPIPSGMGNVPSPDYRVGTTLFIYHLP